MKSITMGLLRNGAFHHAGETVMPMKVMEGDKRL
jgi:hypothetical protein